MRADLWFSPHLEGLRRPDLVELVKLDPTLGLDIRYACRNNFVGRAVYAEARAFLQRPAAEALIRIHQALEPEGLGLLIFDGYRPWSVTRLFWEITPPAQRAFVADPRRGSRHNRGCAVDLTLFDLSTGDPVPMPSDFDEMTERSHLAYGGGSDQEQANRQRLYKAMTSGGFSGFGPEWWHYDYHEWDRYPVMDLAFTDILASLEPHQ